MERRKEEKWKKREIMKGTKEERDGMIKNEGNQTPPPKKKKRGGEEERKKEGRNRTKKGTEQNKGRTVKIAHGSTYRRTKGKGEKEYNKGESLLKIPPLCTINLAPTDREGEEITGDYVY